MVWQQVYNPFGNMIVSTALAAIPVVVMLVSLGLLHVKAHYAAGLGLLSAVLIAVFAFGMRAHSRPKLKASKWKIQSASSADTLT